MKNVIRNAIVKQIGYEKLSNNSIRCAPVICNRITRKIYLTGYVVALCIKITSREI